MAIVDRTRELEPAKAGGRSAGTAAPRCEMLGESERLFGETGRYWGLERPRPEGRGPDPLREALLAACAAASSPRARPRSTSRASPIVKEIGELCFALYTPEGDSVALSTGIIVHVHTMSDAIKYMIRQGYEENPGIAPGDIFTNNDAMIGDVHNADVQTIVPIFWEGELVGWAGGVTHEIDIGAKTPGGVPVGPDLRASRTASTCPPRRSARTTSCWRDHVLAGLKGTRTPMYWTLDEKTRLAGCHDDPRGGRAGDPRGGHRHLQAVRPRGDRGRAALVPEPRARDDRSPAATARPRSWTCRFAKEEQLPGYARRDT